MKLVIPVDKKHLRIIDDPFGRHNTIHALVKVGDLPANLPLENNPRSQNTESRTARSIAETLKENPNYFHVLNRGLTVTAGESHFDNKAEELTLTFPSKHYGVLDGGHTYAVILENRGETPPPAYVRLEVLTGLKSDELIVDVARARNTSSQVKDESLINLQGSFDWVKKSLDNTDYLNKIAWRENEDQDEKPLDVREIIAFLTMYHPAFRDSDNPPIIAYSSKGRCLEMFANQDEDIQKGYLGLRKILPDILHLFDYAHSQFEDMYRKLGGVSGLAGKPTGEVKLGKVVDVKHIKQGFPLYYLGKPAEFRFPSSWIYPIVAAHRALVNYKGVYSWKCNPERFFDKYGLGLFKSVLEASREFRPNQLGKSRNLWTQLHEKTENNVLRLGNGEVITI